MQWVEVGFISVIGGCLMDCKGRSWEWERSRHRVTALLFVHVSNIPLIKPLIID